MASEVAHEVEPVGASVPFEVLHCWTACLVAVRPETYHPEIAHHVAAWGRLVNAP